MVNLQLPADVDEIMDYIGEAAKLSGYLKWNEEAKLKADMMNVRHRWVSRVSEEALRKKCRAVDLTDAETAKILECLRKIQDGRQLVPHKMYRAFRFTQEPA
ncbi:hypothetical protein ACGFOM_25005 [Streptomyces sp. NPDC048594]|uniref:hypothetical protein n=1 Tax=Streptomyces sp. NPDC048594 TaxID=3365575 RepID=UPI003713A7F5